MSGNNRYRGWHRYTGGLAGTALLILLASFSARAQITPPADGVKMPPAYYDRIAKDPTAFQFRHAWIHLARRIRENREAYERGEISREEAMARGGMVFAGTKYVPVLTGKYANTGADPYPVSDLQTELFDGPWPTGTMTQFYSEISYGNVNLTGTVYNWVTVSQNDTYYEGTTNGLGFDARTGEFLKEILDANDPTVDFGLYDNDGPDGIPNSGDDDGFVDFVAFVHPESGGECGNSNMWSHRWVYSGWWGTSYTTNDPSANGGFIKVEDYVIQPAFNCSGTTMIEIGVFCHEFGHAFGLPDLYDTDTGAQASEGIGHWGLMGSGNWNSPTSPAHMCPWSKIQLGWLTPTVITPATNISGPDELLNQLGEALQTLNNVEFNPEVIKVYATSPPGSEYFLIENRQPMGFDANVHSSGLVIWHIDDAMPDNNSQWYPGLNPANHYKVAVEQADGNWDLEHNTNRGDAGDAFASTFFDCNTTPNTDSYTSGPSFISMSNISASGDPMTFDLTFNCGAPSMSVSPTSFSVTLPPNGSTVETLTISNAGQGTLSFSLTEVPPAMMTPEGDLVQISPDIGRGNTETTSSLSRSPQVSGTPSSISRPLSFVPDPGTESPPTGLPEAISFSDSIVYDLYGSVTSSFIGFGTATPFYAATRFTPATAFTLTHVRVRYRTETSTSPVEVLVYRGGTTAPGTLEHSQSYSGTAYQSTTGKFFLLELSTSLNFATGEDFWIVMHYLDVPFPQSASTDGVNQTGRMMYSSSGTAWTNLGDLIANGTDDAWVIRALEAADIAWLQLSPTSGTVTGGGSTPVNVTFDATGLATGTYTGTIRITSNDPVNSTTDIPVTLNVVEQVTVNAKAFLEGPYQPGTGGNPGTMNTYLGDNDLLPHSQPFNTAPWNYTGTESVTTLPAGVVDWVLLELRTTPTGTAVARRAAFLKSDGSIVDTDGTSPVTFNSVAAGDYYIIVRHRNHLAIMSAAPQTLSQASPLYDFTTAQAQAFGTNPMRDLGDGFFGMVSGDGEADGDVDAADKNLVWRPQNGTAWSYTKYGDYNLDGGIDALDLNLEWRPDNGSATQVP